MKRILILSPVALAACVPAGRAPGPPPPAPRVAAPAPAPAPAPALGPDWRDWPLTPGTWRYVRDSRGSTALFGEAGGGARLTLRCDPAARRVVLSVDAAASTPATIRTTSVTRVVPLEASAATLAPADPLLDALAFSRGRFTVERSGAAPLVVPSYPEVGRVVEDCRY